MSLTSPAPSPWLAWRPGEDVAARSAQVHTAHEQFLTSDTLPSGMRNVVLESWARSRSGGVDPDAAGAAMVLSDDELRTLRAEHPLAAVLPVVRRVLVEDATDSGLLVAISDAQGRLLWVEGDPYQREQAAAMRFVEGADWSEHAAGTNAPGTALALDHSVQIFGGEHYSRTVQRWSCSAAPVHDPTSGELLGAIDITGGDRVAAPEMLTLVRATVAAVEAELRVRHLSGVRGPAGTPRLTVLGRHRPVLVGPGGSTTLSLRHAEILLLLAGRPDGLRGEELAVLLAEHELDRVTVRAEVSRLRRVVGPALLDSRPYRLRGTVRTDVDHVRALLAAGDRTSALRAGIHPVLPTSVAPGVVALREELRAELRAALLRAPVEVGLLLDYLSSAHGREDTAAWQACLQVLPPGSPHRDTALARLDLMGLRPAPGHAATGLQPRHS